MFAYSAIFAKMQCLGTEKQVSGQPGRIRRNFPRMPQELANQESEGKEQVLGPGGLVRAVLCGLA